MSKQCLFFKLNPTYRAAVGVWLARPLPILKSSIGKCVFNSFWVDATFKQVVLRDLLTIRMGLKGCIRPLAIINLSWPERKEKETSQIQSYPRLQQFIQLYCYLYITDTLYSGEIIGRIIHGTLCDAPQGHKYWCGRPERGNKAPGGRLMDCTHFPWPTIICLSTVSLPAYLPVPTETHLTATWGEKPSPAATLNHIQPPFLPQSNPPF